SRRTAFTPPRTERAAPSRSLPTPPRAGSVRPAPRGGIRERRAVRARRAPARQGVDRHTRSVAVALVLGARFGCPRGVALGPPLPLSRRPIRKRDRKKPTMANFAEGRVRSESVPEGSQRSR